MADNFEVTDPYAEDHVVFGETWNAYINSLPDGGEEEEEEEEDVLTDENFFNDDSNPYRGNYSEDDQWTVQ